MSINKKIIGTALIGVIFGISSCKKFLNVNTNPNYAQQATIQTLLPAAQLYVGTSVGVDLEIDGSFFAQYWTQSPGASQYHSLDQYAPGQDAFSVPWTNLYAAAENFYQLYQLADSQKAPNYMAISLLMRAYTFQLITDAWGSVPCSQALQGQYANGHLVNPSYDAQIEVYDTIFSYIAQANALINASTSSPVIPTSDDLVYGGKMSNWQAFGNTLALRASLRMSQINPVAAADSVAALYARNATFIGANQDAAISTYGSSAANENPLYAESVGLNFVQNIVGSAFCLDTMLSDGDPRANIFYTPGSGQNSLVGLQQGLYAVAYTGYAYPSVFVGGDALNYGINGIPSYGIPPYYTSGNSGKAPVNFITSYESYFLQAEAAARGWIPGAAAGSDAGLFYQGIQANFNYYSSAFQALDSSGGFYGVVPSTGAVAYTNYIASPTAYWTHYPTSGTIAQRVQFIITQKYFAMCGNQGFEAWSEWRRTGYPTGMLTSVSSIIGTSLEPASAGGVFPKRFTYPSSESTVNGSFPGLQPITANVWWDLF